MPKKFKGLGLLFATHYSIRLIYAECENFELLYHTNSFIYAV